MFLFLMESDRDFCVFSPPSLIRMHTFPDRLHSVDIQILFFVTTSVRHRRSFEPHPQKRLVAQPGRVFRVELEWAFLFPFTSEDGSLSLFGGLFFLEDLAEGC